MDEERLPVVIGTGQLVDRDATVERSIEPLEMLRRVAVTAADDAGVGEAALADLDTVALVGTAGWHPANPANLVACAVGAKPANEFTTGTGGQMGVSLLNHVCGEILEGRSQLALIAGCNNLRVLLKARRQGIRLDWTRGGEGTATMVGTDEPGSSELEGDYGLRQPPDIYPLFENALRARQQMSLTEHRQQMGELFAPFTEVAEANPYAWFPVRRTAEELTNVTPENRMIAFPYPKYLNAILNTEQAAGLLVCSAAEARRRGIPAERWVYWSGGAKSNEAAWWATERPDLAQCPAMADTHVSALVNAGLDLDEVDHFDFYSCFPVAVEMACEMLGLPLTDPRGFTVTGGLPYAGGPASAYTLHSLAEMARRLRSGDGSSGLVTGNGWYLTKHSAAVLSTRPPEHPRNGLIEDLPSKKMRTQASTVLPDTEGQGHVLTYTVLYDRDGSPARGIVVGDRADGSRFVANTPDSVGFLTDFVAAERVGCQGSLRLVDRRLRFEP